MGRLVGAGHAACPRCSGGLPGDVHDDLVCRCGTGVEPVDWQWITTMLMIRSGSRCEIQSPECLGGPHGDLTHLSRMGGRSIHHRRPRGMGGTRRADVHSLAVLVNTCGDGVRGCHGYTEDHGTWAVERGLKLPKEAVTDPRDVPLVLPSGRRVLLDPDGPFYRDPPDGVYYTVADPSDSA